MKISDAGLNGIKIIDNFRAEDERGCFIKIFNSKEFGLWGLRTDFKEVYYSVSKKNTIRGMHFQTPPFEQAKLVHVIKGAVLDVVVDLRGNSETFGKTFQILLEERNAKALYIPEGFAHGFLSLENDTIMLYNVTSLYCRECDMGIRWDSIQYDWKVESPIVSKRDKEFPTLKEITTPF